MDKRESELQRLLRAARGESSAPEMPYGFDTRVVALARATQRERGREAPAVARFFRRIAAAAVTVALFASAATYWQLEQNDELGEPLSNAYAMVDNAINSEFVE
jgi:hypothetical protein